MTRIEYGVATGLKNVYFAPLVQDDDTGAAYDTPIKIGDTITVKPSFEFAEGGLDADDRRIIDDAILVGIKYQINTAQFSPAVHAKILGKSMDANGGVITRDGDESPEGALLYQVTQHNGKSKYVCVYKGRFKDYAEEAQTKVKGQKNYHTPTIEFSAYKRADGLLRYELSEDTLGYNKSVVAGWFSAVTEPAAPVAPPTL